MNILSDINARKLLNNNLNTTTYSESYVKYDEPYKPTSNFRKAKADKPRQAPPPEEIIDMETLTRLKKKVPMTLMMDRNDIVGVNPHEPIKHVEIPEDIMKEEVIKTRPRIYVSPQGCIDNVTDQTMRKMILDYTYTTDFRKAESELLSMVGIEHRHIPESVVEHQKFLETSVKSYFNVAFRPNTILLPKMTPEQNIRGEQWTNKQIVGMNNATEHFWKNKGINNYRNPSSLLEHETKENIAKLVSEEKLRIPYDITCPSYSGFKPVTASGNCEKLKLPLKHPLLSTYQTSYTMEKKT